MTILAEELYEDLEPVPLLPAAGRGRYCDPGPEAKAYESKHGYPAKADVAASDVSAADFGAVVVPGGFAPDRLRRYPAVLDLVRGVSEKNGVIGAIAMRRGCQSRPMW